MVIFLDGGDDMDDKAKYFLYGFTLGAKPVIKNIEVNNVKNQQLYVTENGTYVPDEGYTGFDTVDVDVPRGTEIKNEDITVTQNGVYKASSGFTGLGTVTVRVDSTDPPGPKPFPTMDVSAFRYTLATEALAIHSKLMTFQIQRKTFVLKSKLMRVEEVQ